MKVSASWSGSVSPVIRVTLTVGPGELHPAIKTPLEAEAWLKTLLGPHNEPPKEQP